MTKPEQNTSMINGGTFFMVCFLHDICYKTFKIPLKVSKLCGIEID